LPNSILYARSCYYPFQATFKVSSVAEYEFASSDTTRMTFEFNTCFVWKLAPPADELNSFFHKISIATIDVIEHIFNVANSYLTL
jgi:hypothetical protein